MERTSIMFNRKHILLGDMSTETLWEAYCAAYYKIYSRLPKYSSTLSRHYLISKTAALRAKGTVNASKSM
jgi:hypothetical protein